MTAPVLDPRWLPEEARFRVAEAVRTSYDVELPMIDGWNGRPCLRHSVSSGGAPDGLVASCPRCGIRPRRHQRVGITWLYLTPRAALLDGTGLGKTVQIAGLLGLLRTSGELAVDGTRKALLIVRAATIVQWRDQLARMLPDMRVTCVTGDAKSRARALSGCWEVALCGPEMMVSKSSRAVDQLARFDFGTLVCDDIAALANDNKTSRMIRKLADKADRVVVATATPLDKRLRQLYDTGRVLGWQSVLGTEEEFTHRYVNMEQVWYTPRLKPVRCRWCRCTLTADHRQKAWLDERKQRGPCPAARTPGQPHFPLSRTQPGAQFQWVEKGVNLDNLEEFRARIAPLVLRRTAADCDDVSMPAVQVSRVPVVLGADQRKRYEEVRKGILTRLDEAGNSVTRAEEDALFVRARQITSGLANLDKGRSGQSAKLDLVTDWLTGDLAGEPVVVYCYFRPTLADLASRLEKEGISSVRIWGEQHASEQANAIAAFDAGVSNVMLITDAGGMGLNLQRSRRLIIVDPPLSAGRLRQIIGREVRDGSEHSTVYVQMLFSDTPLDRALEATLGEELDMFAAVLGDGTDDLAWDRPGSKLRAVTG